MIEEAVAGDRPPGWPAPATAEVASEPTTGRAPLALGFGAEAEPRADTEPGGAELVAAAEAGRVAAGPAAVARDPAAGTVPLGAAAGAWAGAWAAAVRAALGAAVTAWLAVTPRLAAAP